MRCIRNVSDIEILTDGILLLKKSVCIVRVYGHTCAVQGLLVKCNSVGLCLRTTFGNSLGSRKLSSHQRSKVTNPSADSRTPDWTKLSPELDAPQILRGHRAGKPRILHVAKPCCSPHCGASRAAYSNPASHLLAPSNIIYQKTLSWDRL